MNIDIDTIEANARTARDLARDEVPWTSDLVLNPAETLALVALVRAANERAGIAEAVAVGIDDAMRGTDGNAPSPEESLAAIADAFTTEHATRIIAARDTLLRERDEALEHLHREQPTQWVTERMHHFCPPGCTIAPYLGRLVTDWQPQPQETPVSQWPQIIIETDGSNVTVITVALAEHVAAGDSGIIAYSVRNVIEEAPPVAEPLTLPAVKTPPRQSNASRVLALTVAYGFIALTAALIFSLGAWGVHAIWASILG